MPVGETVKMHDCLLTHLGEVESMDDFTVTIGEEVGIYDFRRNNED